VAEGAPANDRVPELANACLRNPQPAAACYFAYFRLFFSGFSAMIVQFNKPTFFITGHTRPAER